MQFQQGKDHTGKAKLEAKEHFILSNFVSRLPIYVLMWGVCLCAAWLLSTGQWVQPVTDYAGMRAFSIAFVTIATTTITFAIPTCMRAIFSTYEQYYSTKISEILLNRFPVTLLTLSAFTSLLVSVSIVSGIVGVAIPVSPAAAFYVALFWTLVCIFYLFIAIEKMVYFIANAPYAVIEKLEYGVGAISEIRTSADYKRFRQELASMNDIASTILNRSTGYDETITETLDAFRQIHKHYLETANPEDPKQLKYHINACRAVDHEIVRMFRTACSVKNEQACANIIETYCEMLSDALSVSTNIGYFSDMMGQVMRFQSYASACAVEEIKLIASVNWFFTLSQVAPAEDAASSQMKYSIIVRTMTALLRAATESADDGVVVRFLRVASDSEIEFDVSSMSPLWKIMLDRVVFVYATWLIDFMPDHAERYIEYIERYSSVDSNIFRSVLPDTVQRVDKLLVYENILQMGKGAAECADDIESKEEAKVSDGRTAMVLSLNLKSTAAHTMMISVILDRNGIPYSHMDEQGRLGRAYNKELAYIRKNIKDENVLVRINLASILDSNLYRHIAHPKEQ